jgi:hypothetical protein
MSPFPVPYADLLSRPAEQEGADFWTFQLDHGYTTLTPVALNFLSATETMSNRVDSWYERFLFRPADGGALAYFVPLLQKGLQNPPLNPSATDQEVQAALLASGEGAKVTVYVGHGVEGTWGDSGPRCQPHGRARVTLSCP